MDAGGVEVIVFGSLAILVCGAVAVMAVRGMLASNRLLRAILAEQLGHLMAYSEEQRNVMYEKEQTERAALELRARRESAANKYGPTEWIGGEPPDPDADHARVPDNSTGL